MQAQMRTADQTIAAAIWVAEAHGGDIRPGCWRSAAFHEKQAWMMNAFLK